MIRKQRTTDSLGVAVESIAPVAFRDDGGEAVRACTGSIVGGQQVAATQRGYRESLEVFAADK
jgi:hypothetical protein